MAYDAFIQVITQLSGQKRARIVVKEQVIFIDRLDKNRKKNLWNLSSVVFHGEGYLPPSIRDCVSSSGVLRWEENGAELRVDPLTKSVYLVQEIDAANRYIPFRYFISDFATLAQEWRTYFDDLTSRDSLRDSC